MEKTMFENYDDLYDYTEEIFNQLYIIADCGITKCSDCTYSSLCKAIIDLKTHLLFDLIDIIVESEDW